jgi:hypothetical protein
LPHLVIVVILITKLVILCSWKWLVTITTTIISNQQPRISKYLLIGAN